MYLVVCLLCAGLHTSAHAATTVGPGLTVTEERGEWSTEQTDTGHNTTAAPQWYYGYDIRGREHADSAADTMYIMSPSTGLPREGVITGWRLYANRTANITMLVFRPHDGIQHQFLLLGYNNITVLRTGVVEYNVPVSDMVHIRPGDLLGLFFRHINPIPFTKANKTQCLHRNLYAHQPRPFSAGKLYTFRDHESGWNPCRVFSFGAVIANSTDPDSGGEDDNGAIKESAATASNAPLTTSMEVRLVNGRSSREGLVQVLQAVGPWHGVSDDGWDDTAASVVCRQLGYEGGYAQYSPFYGQPAGKLDSCLTQVGCSGEESQLSECSFEVSSLGCGRDQEAGVHCFSLNDTGSPHVFGFPASVRSHLDRWPRGVYIPQLSQPLPWRRGLITGWHFYVESDHPVSLALQVWRPRGLNSFMLVGSTSFFDLKPGRHNRQLDDSQTIEFQSGDVIGLHIDTYNSIPYDLLGFGQCSEDNVFFLDVGGIGRTNLKQGQVYDFSEKPATWAVCRMYSLYATFTGSVAVENSSFSTGSNTYHVVLDETLTQTEAESSCNERFGLTSSLARVISEDELYDLVGFLHQLQLTSSEEMWVGGNPRDAGLVTKWGHCQPASGKECIVFRKERQMNTPFDSFYMFTRVSHEQRHFICQTPTAAVEEEERQPSTPSSHLKHVPLSRFPTRDSQQYDSPFSQVSGIHVGLVLGLVAGLVSITVIVLTRLLCTHWHRRRTMFTSPSDNFRVRFVSLDDKPDL